MQYNLKGFRSACAYLNYTLTKLFIREAEQSGNDATDGRGGRGKQLIRMNLSRNSAPTLFRRPVPFARASVSSHLLQNAH